jgi:DNA-binding transcriptional ArsR family regulator
MTPAGLPHPVPPARVDLIAARLRALGEPVRIRLVDRLRDGEATVAQLTDSVGCSQQNVSKHLAVLHQAGLLRRRRDGTHVLYSIADDSVLEVCAAAWAGVEARLSALTRLVEEDSGPLRAGARNRAPASRVAGAVSRPVP